MLKTFKDLGLIPQLQRAIDEVGYEQPTEIQARAIPEALEGCDILGCAQTGTGKTAAFVLPTLDYIADQMGQALSGKPFALILAPTRELALQIGQSIETYGRHLKIRSSVIYGGVNQANQVRSLHRGVEILVATPGRLLDLMQQGFVDLSHLEIFVLDEADRMLDMGFLPDLKRIIRKLPEERQSLFFSATLETKVAELAKSLLFEPKVVSVTPEPKSEGKIEQHLLLVESREKPHRLSEVLSNTAIRLALVFTQTKRAANQVEKKLREQGIKAAAIHGNKSQANRQRTLDAFRRGEIRVLVATDLAARGIDVSDVTHVVNYDLPADPENYVHRIGRTGRAGRTGTAITFYTSQQRQELRAITRFAGINSPENDDERPSNSRSTRGARPQASRARNSSRNQPSRPQQSRSQTSRSQQTSRPQSTGRPPAAKAGKPSRPFKSFSSNRRKAAPAPAPR